MKTRFVQEGNAFYEIDEECMKKREKCKKMSEEKNVGNSNVRYEKKMFMDVKSDTESFWCNGNSRNFL